MNTVPNMWNHSLELINLAYEVNLGGLTNDAHFPSYLLIREIAIKALRYNCHADFLERVRAQMKELGVN